MPLARLSIGDVVQVAAGQTVPILTVSNSEVTFIRTLIIHAASLESTTPDAPVNVQIYVVPNNQGNVGVATAGHRIARVNLAANDTFFVEPEYPIILDTNNDTLKVYNEGTNNAGASAATINVLAMGDREVP